MLQTDRKLETTRKRRSRRDHARSDCCLKQQQKRQQHITSTEPTELVSSLAIDGRGYTIENQATAITKKTTRTETVVEILFGFILYRAMRAVHRLILKQKFSTLENIIK